MFPLCFCTHFCTPREGHVAADLYPNLVAGPQPPSPRWPPRRGEGPTRLAEPARAPCPGRPPTPPRDSGEQCGTRLAIRITEPLLTACISCIFKLVGFAAALSILVVKFCDIFFKLALRLSLSSTTNLSFTLRSCFLLNRRR